LPTASASGTWKFRTSCEYWMYVASNATVRRSKNRYDTPAAATSGTLNPKGSEIVPVLSMNVNVMS
jgi:hypothetical protein